MVQLPVRIIAIDPVRKTGASAEPLPSRNRYRSVASKTRPSAKIPLTTLGRWPATTWVCHERLNEVTCSDPDPSIYDFAGKQRKRPSRGSKGTVDLHPVSSALASCIAPFVHLKPRIMNSDLKDYCIQRQDRKIMTMYVLVRSHSNHYEVTGGLGLLIPGSSAVTTFDRRGAKTPAVLTAFSPKHASFHALPGIVDAKTSVPRIALSTWSGGSSSQHFLPCRTAYMARVGLVHVMRWRVATSRSTIAVFRTFEERNLYHRNQPRPCQSRFL